MVVSVVVGVIGGSVVVVDCLVVVVVERRCRSSWRARVVIGNPATMFAVYFRSDHYAQPAM